tara:strand:- start:57 stop:896 length:840 start_codon:yes stop_codon:yes gene_type:complete
MKNKTIGVIGNGFVGNAVATGFRNAGAIVKVHDKDPNKCVNTLEETLQSDFIFVCLPTPMVSAEGGDVDLTILKEFFNQPDLNRQPIYIIKSTVPVGTTSEIIKNSDVPIMVVHNPEFLTAANAEEDFINAERTVIGGTSLWASCVADLYKTYWPDTPVITVSSDASEMIKYTANSFLALKVTYFNMVFDYCVNMGIDYSDVLSGVCSDSRIGSSHTQVPGPDGDRGYGGTCFPKDINAMKEMFLQAGVDHGILSDSWNYNKDIRENWDWANNPSAVSS